MREIATCDGRKGSWEGMDRELPRKNVGGATFGGIETVRRGNVEGPTREEQRESYLRGTAKERTERDGGETFLEGELS